MKSDHQLPRQTAPGTGRMAARMAAVAAPTARIIVHDSRARTDPCHLSAEHPAGTHVTFCGLSIADADAELVPFSVLADGVPTCPVCFARETLAERLALPR